MKRKLSTLCSQLPTQGGFTLIELTVYMGILAILISVLSSVFGSIVDVQLQSGATSSVDQDGRYIMAKLTHDVKSASAMILPANPGDVTDTLQITINSINYTYGLDSNNNLEVTDDGSGTSDMLNSYDTSVSNLSFTRIGSGDNNDTVNVSYTLTSRTKDENGQVESETFQTTLGME
jgi:prepilin-type N-terminal cleavage/methylation domain-containing protein